jgi:lipoprotein-releasing system permease protein
MPTEWIIALRFLREGRFQSALIIGGIAVGAGVIMALTTLIVELQASLIARTLGTQAHIVIRPPEDEAARVYRPDSEHVLARVERRAQRLRSIDQWQQLLVDIERDSAIAAVSPMASGPGFATRGNATKSVAILGMEPERYLHIVRMHEKMLAGSFRVSATETVIGIELGRDLGVGIGDKLRLSTPEGRAEVLSVVGLFDVGNKDLNRRWVFTALRTAQTLLDLPGGVTSIDLTVDRLFDAEEIARSIGARTGAQVESWMQSNAQLLTALNNQRITNMLLRVFIIIIVAFGIASTLVVSVVQKSREIGILRAMGASRARVMRVFLVQGALVALVGSALGAVLGAVLVKFFSQLSRNVDGTSLISGNLDPWLVAQSIAIVTTIGVLSALAPARRAAALDPVQAIRYG